ncbi:MAG: hypothetical protein PUI30_05155, partial [Bacteroidales bacterium]|nr:hypothetical protein [Bacteroidales bacterium]
RNRRAYILCEIKGIRKREWNKSEKGKLVCSVLRIKGLWLYDYIYRDLRYRKSFKWPTIKAYSSGSTNLMGGSPSPPAPPT